MPARSVLDPADGLAIHQLLSLYGHLVDARDWAALGELFTEDAALDATVYGLPLVVGRPAIVDFYAGARHPAAHHCTNPVIRVGEGPVRVHSKWLVGYPDGTTAGGDYHDQVVPGSGAWLFLERRITRRWPDASRAALAAQAQP